VKLKKVTTSGRGEARRRYDDACGTAHALDLVGERWALLVIRELLLGPKRFSDLKADLPGISANTLTQRLESLESSGLVIRRRLPPPASTQVYELTAWGYEAEPIVCTLGRWAARSPDHDPALPLSATSLILSFRTMFDPARAKGIKAQIAIEAGRESFAMTIGGGRMAAARGELADPDLRLAGAPTAIAAAVYGGLPVAELEAGGALRVDGDRDLLARFLTLFPLPLKVGPTAAGERRV
jgi:DNA-binding HxlR family transcriptional regulator